VHDRPDAVLATADADVVVVIAGDGRLPEGWLPGLLAPFADPAVGAVGPVSNDAPPAQRIELEDVDVTDAAALDAAAAAWAATHEGGAHLAPRLDRRFWAVRVSAARAVGALMTGGPLAGIELDDLCRRLAIAGFKIVVAESVYVHVAERSPDRSAVATEEAAAEIVHLTGVAAAARRDPLLSAALIVKNEEDNLPKCLASLSGLVDEVVVYDTGSTDRTVEIARDAGARVIEGYWDDDFSRARNEAIAHCNGEWVLSIDADEIATGDPAAVRCALEINWGVDVLVVQITNVLGGGASARAGLDHQGPRLLRRSRCRWRFRLHEQPYTPAGEPPMRGGRISYLRLLHTGYTDDAAAARDKVARNIRVAEEGLAELVEPDSAELVANLVNLGRSYTWAGRHDDALSCYERAIDIDAPSGYRRTALTHGFESLLAMGRLDDAEEWLGRLRDASSEGSLVPRYLDGLLRFRRGDVTGALEQLNGIDALADDDGTSRGTDFVAKVRGMAYLANGDWADAFESLMIAATSGGTPAWGPMAIAAANTTADLAVVAALVTHDTLLAACAEIVTSVPALAPAFLEALWEGFEGDPRLLGAAALLGPRLSVARALEWSARLRAVGAADRCPLRALVRASAVPAAERLRAAAVLEAAFGEQQAPSVLVRIAGELDPTDVARTGAELVELCPRVGRTVLDHLVASPA